MTDVALQTKIILEKLEHAPIQDFPRALAYHQENGFTIILYRDELRGYTDEQNQQLFRFLMDATRQLNSEFKIPVKWVRE